MPDHGELSDFMRLLRNAQCSHSVCWQGLPVNEKLAQKLSSFATVNEVRCPICQLNVYGLDDRC